MVYLLPVLFALFVWWASTVLLLYRTGLPEATYRRSLGVATALVPLLLVGLVRTTEDATPAGAYLGFVFGLLLWGWHELSYYTGLISGPRPRPCPPGVGHWQRFRLGVQASLWHELAIVATALALALVSFGTANPVGLWTFVILWLMRWSAKLNIFLGVRNLHQEFWPEHLNYLSSYVANRVMNPLFPWSVAAGVGICAWLVHGAVAGGAGAYVITANVLLATILLLAVLEHCFLMLPLSDDVLWRWGRGQRATGDSASSAPTAGSA